MRSGTGAEYRVDVSPSSALAVCDCGARFLAAARPAAARALAEHMRRGHPEISATTRARVMRGSRARPDLGERP